jgi:hypothetical protein
VLLAAVGLAFAYWPLYPAVRDVARAAGDPALDAAYHAPLVAYLQARPDAGAFRVEIPPTENHWEARYVAPAVALARGWERQLDRRFGALFYDGRLDAARYRAWLDDNAVGYVAIPDADLDYAGVDEARLVERGLPYLRQVWHAAHWRVFAVSRRAALASGAGATATLDPGGVTLHATRPGDIRLRVHHTRWWHVTAGRGCVRGAGDALTRVRVRAPGRVRLQPRLTGSSCRR